MDQKEIAAAVLSETKETLRRSRRGAPTSAEPVLSASAVTPNRSGGPKRRGPRAADSAPLHLTFPDVSAALSGPLLDGTTKPPPAESEFMKSADALKKHITELLQDLHQ